MTCDPIGGLVQIPCIERNAVGAVRAIHAARMAMEEEDPHHVSLDAVIEVMFRTGLDMQTKYKETSLGGLAVGVVEC
jgi:L-serine dehydratase